MLIKFETKCARVKGVSFHPKRPWILASLHTGSIVLWDYQLNNCVDKFEGHDGPVRGLCFHSQQPIFVSGGDDYMIKVWNYQKSKCLFNLVGHMDYIRSTNFHSKQPWIISCSDDQTVRIWNWQSRKKIALLTGHNHYVMCAQFHPNEDLVVSASLDQTVRVWDISGLVKRHTSATFPANSEKAVKGKMNVDLFGESGATTRYILEGHDKGVNWVTFHPNLPLIVSGGDDRYIKLWRIGDDKCWELDTLRGHYKNVSSVLFHPRKPIIISASEDKALRVWDMTKRASLQTFRRNLDRFWIVEAHPTKNLFCAGHDSGLMIFKLERERPVWALHDGNLFYIKERHLRRSNLSTGEDVPIMRLRGEGHGSHSSLCFNPAENSILLSNYESGYELYAIPVAKDSSSNSLPPDSPRDWKKSIGRSATWIGRNRFAVLVNENQLLIKNTKNEVCKKIQIPFNCFNIFTAGSGMLLIQQQPNNLDAEKGASNVVLFDIQLKQVVAKHNANCKIKRVVWSNDKSRVALLGKQSITFCNRKLELYTTLIETGKIKSGAWREPCSSDIGVFIYNTGGHLKYAITNGDTGTIRTMDICIYITSVKNDEILCFDRAVKPYKFPMDTTELCFKLSLITGQYDQVIQMVRSCKLVGQAIISYLHRKGYPEIALHFLQKQDERTRFNLALECCNLEVAVECARVLDSSSVWNKLGETALLLGNLQIIELCYQRTKSIHKLAFFYLITGNIEKLKKLLKASVSKGQSRSLSFWMALVSGDVEGQIKLLANAGSEGKTVLAYKLALGFGLADTADEIASGLDPEQLNIKVNKSGHVREEYFGFPPAPLFEQIENWPQLMVTKSLFEGPSSTSFFKLDASNDFKDGPAGVVGAWIEGDFCEVPDDDQIKNTDIVESEVSTGGGWDDDNEIVLPSSSSTNLVDTTTDNYYVTPVRGTSVPEKWINAYAHPVVHVISGNFESAARLLQEQRGVVNIEPFRKHFLYAYQKNHVVFIPMPNTPVMRFYPMMESGKKEVRHPMACKAFTLEGLVNEKLKACYEKVSRGQFMEAVDAFQDLLLSVPLTVHQSKTEIIKEQELIILCKEYILGLQMEIYRKTLPKDSSEDQRRSLELAAYFTHSSLDNVHLMLALRTAMNLSYKLGYLKSASGFARRLLELGPSGDLILQTRKLLKASENKMDSAAAALQYDEHNPFSVCAETYKPIYRGKQQVKCPFCGAAYMSEFNGKLCKICTVSEIGKSVGGRAGLLSFKFS